MRARQDSSPVNLGRHSAECKICAHPQREEIERDFINWRSPAAIAEEYGLKDRSNVYRHAHALDLFPRRQRNVRAALERLIERAGEVEVTASAVVAAVGAYARESTHQARGWSARNASTSTSCSIG